MKFIRIVTLDKHTCPTCEKARFTIYDECPADFDCDNAWALVGPRCRCTYEEISDKVAHHIFSLQRIYNGVAKVRGLMGDIGIKL